jgi:hypothetical protein
LVLNTGRLSQNCVVGTKSRSCSASILQLTQLMEARRPGLGQCLQAHRNPGFRKVRLRLGTCTVYTATIISSPHSYLCLTTTCLVPRKHRRTFRPCCLLIIESRSGAENVFPFPPCTEGLLRPWWRIGCKGSAHCSSS